MAPFFSKCFLRSRTVAPMDKPGAGDKKEQKAHASEEVVQMIEAALEKDGVIADSYEFAQSKNRHHANEVVPSIKSLEANNKVVTAPLSTKTWGLTEEAEGYVLKGSPEAQIWTAVPAEGIDQKALLEKVPNGNIGFAQAMKNKVCVFSLLLPHHPNRTYSGCGWRRLHPRHPQSQHLQRQRDPRRRRRSRRRCSARSSRSPINCRTTCAR